MIRGRFADQSCEHILSDHEVVPDTGACILRGNVVYPVRASLSHIGRDIVSWCSAIRPRGSGNSIGVHKGEKKGLDQEKRDHGGKHEGLTREAFRARASRVYCRDRNHDGDGLQ